MSENMSNACLTCKHRGFVPNSRHSKCLHPDVLHMDCDTTAMVIQRLARKDEVIRITSAMGVQFAEQGVRGNWALWPFNFDPIWLVECLGFEKEGE